MRCRSLEYKTQEYYSSFIQISFFIFLSLPWSFSFLRKFSYSSATFALFTACVSIQFGIIVMQLVDRIHCIFLENMLLNPDPDITKETLASLNFTDFNYQCQIMRPLDEVEDGFGLRQVRQACYCKVGPCSRPDTWAIARCSSPARGKSMRPTCHRHDLMFWQLSELTL